MRLIYDIPHIPTKYNISHTATCTGSIIFSFKLSKVIPCGLAYPTASRSCPLTIGGTEARNATRSAAAHVCRLSFIVATSAGVKIC